MRTNCVNCGAAKDIDEIKCPFCGTTYVDLTAIDFSSDDPVVCQFVLPMAVERMDKPNKTEKNGKMVMSMLAIPKLDEITMETGHMSFNDRFGFSVNSYVRDYSMNVGISFKPVTRPDHQTLFELMVKE